MENTVLAGFLAYRNIHGCGILGVGAPVSNMVNVDSRDMVVAVVADGIGADVGAKACANCEAYLGSYVRANNVTDRGSYHGSYVIADCVTDREATNTRRPGLRRCRAGQEQTISVT